MRAKLQPADILNFLQEKRIELFTLSDLAFHLGITNKTKKDFRDAVSTLIEQNKIVKHKKNYQLIHSPLPSPIGQKKAMIEGVFDATPLAKDLSFAFVRTDQGDFFVSSEDTLNAYHMDKVMIEPFYKHGKSDYCRIVRIVARASQQLAGDIQSLGNRMIFICSNPKIHNWFEVNNPSNDLIGKKVVLEVINWGNRQLSKAPVGKVIEILGRSGDLDVEVISIIRQYQLPLEFTPEQIQEASAFDDVIGEEIIRTRHDFRDLMTITIDPAGAKDYDDAISIIKTDKGWHLYVHIADVAHYVQPDSAIFSEAIKRGNSYYFPKRVIPMLPEMLSNMVCSLRPQEDKLTLTVITDFDQKGRVLKQNLVESVIRSSARLTYEEVDDLFAGRKQAILGEIVRILNDARELSAILSSIRVNNGYLFFDLPEVEYIYNEEGYIHLLSESEETESHKLIENFMLVANEYIAKELTHKAPVTMYRIHDDPDPKRMEKLSDTLSCYGLKIPIRQSINHSIQALLASMPSHEYHVVFDRMVLRSLKKAEYSIKHIRHFGLAMDTYTHFTSPIRRLCDLVVHHLCKIHLLKTSNKHLTKKQIDLYAKAASEKELSAIEAERNVEHIYNLSYMKDKISEIYDALIVRIKNRELHIRLVNLPISGVLNPGILAGENWLFDERAMRLTNKRTGFYFQLLDKIRVQVQEVRDSVVFDLCDGKETHIHLYNARANEVRSRPKQWKRTHDAKPRTGRKKERRK